MAVGSECGQIRVELSARFDGEDDPAGREAVAAHVTMCADCAAWWEQASVVTRLARTAAALPTPGLTDTAMAAIMAAAPEPAPTPARAAAVLRIALLVVGLGQFLLGMAQISNPAGIGPAHAAAGGSVSSGHLWHESAAWNVAIGAAMAWLAWRRTRPASLLPVMTAFVAVLALLTTNDAMAGRVDGSRVLSHSLVLVGYLLLLLASLPRLCGLRPPAVGVGPSTGWSWRGDEDDDGGHAQVLPFPVRAAVTAQQVTAQPRRAA